MALSDPPPKSPTVSYEVGVAWRGKEFGVAVNAAMALREFAAALEATTGAVDLTQKLVPLPAANGLVVHPAKEGHKTLAEVGLQPGSRWKLYGSTASELQELSKAEQTVERVRGFEEELHREAMRRVGGKQPLVARGGASAFRTSERMLFGDLRAWEAPPLQLDPPPAEALRLLRRVASDAGIHGVMSRRGWRVGLLSEMPPEGKVGVSAVCVLGYNVNAGQEIALRLRTDDLKGFRKYDVIIRTLLHELAHMTYSDHDDNFKALNSELTREYGALNWAAADGRTAGSATGAAEYNHSDWAQDVMSVTARSSGQRLGGDDDHTNDDCNFRRRADAVAATTAAGMAAARRHGHGDEDASSLKDAAAAAAEAEPEAAAECGEACPCGACAAPPSFVVGVAHAAIPPPGAEDDVTFERMDMDPSMAPGAPCERLTVDFEPAVTARAETAAAVAEAERAAIAAHAEEASAARDAAAVEAAEAAEARSAMAATATAALAVVTAVAEDDPEVAAIQAAAAATQHRAEQAIQQLVAIAAMADVASSLRTVLRILDNVRDNPHESRFRRLRWANAALRARVQRFPPAVALLRAAGFTEAAGNEPGLQLTRDDPALLYLVSHAVQTCLGSVQEMLA